MVNIHVDFNSEHKKTLVNKWKSSSLSLNHFNINEQRRETVPVSLYSEQVLISSGYKMKIYTEGIGNTSE